mmetsp:Transcript_26497/g.43460  ORF Transcript_26497/g.43460 Transcript_26497/m.43460 type:complete len:163 (+) Transcript_26497:80-568(+)
MSFFVRCTKHRCLASAHVAEVCFPAFFRSRAARMFQGIARPVLPEECEEYPDNCCGNGCETCVWDIYHEHLKRYKEALKTWEAAQVEHAGDAPGRTDSLQIKPGVRARLRNFRHPRLQEMNGLLVEVLERHGTKRWSVRPVGTQRVLRLSPEKLELCTAVEG